MPRDADIVQRVDMKLERMASRLESWYKECRGQASARSRGWNSGTGADKERKVNGFTGRPRDGLVRETL